MTVRPLSLLLAAWLASVPAQAKAPPPPPTKELITALVKAVKANHEPQAVAALEQAVRAVLEPKRKSGEKAQILRAMEGALHAKNAKIVLAAAGALGRAGPPAAKCLAKALRMKRIRRNRELLGAVIDALGLTRDERTGVKTLVNLVQRHKDWGVRALAARALGYFDRAHARGRTRKYICEKLIQVYEGIESQVTTNPRDTTAQRRLAALKPDVLATLRQLSDQEYNSALDWRKWFNDAKRKRWPDPPKKKKRK